MPLAILVKPEANSQSEREMLDCRLDQKKKSKFAKFYEITLTSDLSNAIIIPKMKTYVNQTPVELRARRKANSCEQPRDGWLVLV